MVIKQKTRIFKEHNYKAIYRNYKTYRYYLNDKEPITELLYPEFYDVKITNKCDGKCQYCYMDSKSDSYHFSNILEKIDNFFGKMNNNQRPFQVAIGGGEPTMHPDFISILDKFYKLGITPNYTTNGIELNKDIIKATKKYCGGVAISCHNHLKKYWEKSVNELINNNINLNFHIVIYDKNSINNFINLYKLYKGKISYFVLLPYIVSGRAPERKIEKEYLFEQLKSLGKFSDIAFGAHFYYDFIKNNMFNLSLYEPEIFSKYLDMDTMNLYKSSFDTEQKISYNSLQKINNSI
jgi:MoaA/NifB/PqqE/SkfB family radical SAM enzyme